VARKLGHFKMLLVASPDYIAAHGMPRQVQDLQAHQCMHFRWPHSGKLEAWPLPPADSGEPVNLPVSMVCNNIETRACFALRGRGIACLPDFAIRDALAEGKLVQVMPGLAERTGVFHILWPAGRHAAPKVRALVDYLCARMFAVD